MRGSVIKRNAGYAVKVELPRDPVTGKRRQKWVSGFRTKALAERARVQLLAQLDDGTFIEPDRVTVAEFLEEWISTVRNVRPTTLESYQRWLTTQVVPRIGHVALRRLDGGTLNALYGELLSSGRRDGRGGLSVRSVSYIHTILHRALADAVRWRRLAENPADAADPPRNSGGVARRVRAWDAETVARFLARSAAEAERWHPAWVVLATTGARRGEVLGLRWSDVDLDRGRLSIQQSLTVVRHVPTFAATKTARGRRGVALDDGTVAVLRTWKAQQNAERLALGTRWADTGLVFTRPDGSLVHPEAFSKVFERRVATWGFPTLTIHGLRHTWATVALTQGVHPRVVQERLGHSTIAVTLDTYSHVTASLHDEAARSVAASLLG